MKTYSIDNQECCTLDEIISENDELTGSEINAIENLMINEACWVGIVEIERIS